MEEAQIELQNALTTTFLANLVFLSEYDNELYHRVDELSRMIENGTYKERYALEFNMQDGDFDIYDIINDKYLYNNSPQKYNNELVRKIDFDEKQSILDLPKQYLYKFQEKVDRKDRFDFETINKFSALTFNDTWEYANATGDFLLNRKKRLKDIKKFIFMGTLLGRHIPRIANKINAKIYLVLEKNLEIFRLSLFTVDYTILAQNGGVIFSIMDSVLDTEKKIGQFIGINNIENYLLKFSTTNINVDEYIDNILNSLYLQSPVSYDYNRRLYTNINRSTKYIRNGYKILLFNKIKKDFDLFKNTPILYLAAGPSLDENIDWIKENQNKFFIVTIGAAYKKLLKNKIKIDMITTLDESNILANMQFDDKDVEKIAQNTIILASTITNENVLKKFNQKNLFLYEVFQSMHKNNINLHGFSIGEITLDILLHFNAKEIYIIGLDLALNQETGDSHAKGSDSVISKLKLDIKQDRSTFDGQESLIKVKGNLKEEVFTTPFFFTSIKSSQSKLSKKDDDIKVYNLSLHGAYFENTTPKKIEDIDLSKKADVKNINILSLLSKYSTKRLSISSQKEIKKEIEFIQKDIKDILDDISNKEYKTFKDLFEDIKTIPENIDSFLYQNLVNYFLIVVPYLSYHFNDINVKNESKKVKKIKDIFVNQMKNMFDDYILCLERIID